MKNYFVVFLLAFCLTAAAQAGKNPVQKKQPASNQEMTKIMIAPAIMEKNATTDYYPDFTNNRQLVPAKNAARINAIPVQKLTQANIADYTGGLLNKLLAKGNAGEIAEYKKQIAKTPGANEIGNAVTQFMLKGYQYATMALSMKAVLIDPVNTNYQNNMTALLTQYGYAEYAMPVLEKLVTEFPNSSTVLNNLAYAWFNLGEINKAKQFATMALGANPRHAESNLMVGIINEFNGSHTDFYAKAMQLSPNPFTDKVVKNTGKGIKLDRKIFLKSISIYPFIPKDYYKIPEINNEVREYINTRSIVFGYNDMLDNFITNKLEPLEDKYEDLQDEEMDREEREEGKLKIEGKENEFTPTFNKKAKQMLNKSGYVSLSAVYIIQALRILAEEWREEIKKEKQLVDDSIAIWQKEMEKVTCCWGTGQCRKSDNARTEFMQKANPAILRFYNKQAEEWREFANAFATWNWFVADSELAIADDIENLKVLVTIFKDGNWSRIIEAPDCDIGNREDIAAKEYAVPDIPNFDCPAIVVIPVGNNLQNIMATANSKDENNGHLKQQNKPTPNVTVSYGAGKYISEPGPAASLKTANGSMMPNMGNMSDDGELVPLATDKAISDVIKARRMRDELAKKLLNEMRRNPCNKKDKKTKKPHKIRWTVGPGTLTMEESPPEYTVGQGTLEWIDEDGNVNRVGPDGVTEIFGLDGTKLPTFEIGEGTLEMLDENGNVIPDETITNNESLNHLKETIIEIFKTGLQPTISSGMQAQGTFTANPNLFK